MNPSQVLNIDKNSRLDIIPILVLFVLFVPSSFNSTLNSISLYVLLPSLFVYALFNNVKTIIFKPIFYLLLLYCWSILTVVKSRNIELSIEEIYRLTGVFILCYLFVFYGFKNTKYIYIIYALYILKFLTMFYYAYTHDLLVSTERFSLDELNANKFGYYGFFAIVSSFFLWQKSQTNLFLKRFFFAMFILCVIISIISCFFAASRAGILITIFTLVLFLVINFSYPLNKKSLLNTALFLIIGLVLFLKFGAIYKGSILESRFQIESIQNESRFELVINAFNVGISNPIFGVGPGNFMEYNTFRLYSHSTYMELFANNGIIAVMIYLCLLIYFFKRSYMLFKLKSDSRRYSLFFICFAIIYCIYNIFYVFHTQIFMLSFFILVLTHLTKMIEDGKVSQDQKDDDCASYYTDATSN